MNNQGLDALAALAAAASHSPYPSVSNNGGQQGKEETKNDNKTTTTSTDAPTQAPQTVNPSLPEMAAQQWQHAIANAASSIGGALSGPNGQNNLALLGMQQQLHQAAASNPNLIAIQQQLAMQQQLNYYQLLAHAASQQQQRQQQFGANQAMNAATTVPGTASAAATSSAAQALSQVLGVHAVQQTPFPGINGTFHSCLSVYLYVCSISISSALLLRGHDHHVGFAGC